MENKDGKCMSDILIGNGTVVTLGNDNRLIEQGAVLVQDSRIATIGSDTELRQMILIKEMPERPMPDIV